MNNIPKVSIGISAFNEEANIKNLLESLLRQEEDGFVLHEIMVISDASTDATVAKIKEVASDKIQLIDNQKRSGKPVNQNTLAAKLAGDIMVFFDADVLPADNKFLMKVIAPIKNDPRVGLVGAKLVPARGVGLFERTINFSVHMKLDMFEQWNYGHNLYSCRGAARAFSQAFLKTVKWPNLSSEDVYSYLSCIKSGFIFRYQPEAVVYYKSPVTFRDNLKQSRRFVQGPEHLVQFFGKELVDSPYRIPFAIKLKSSLKYLFQNPFLFSMYILALVTTRALVYILPRTKAGVWSIVQTSKDAIVRPVTQKTINE
jgi:poly-beta-1,6-N-acetyl-D-glucosamine synthase